MNLMNFKTKHFWKNDDGLATIESAILLPMMLVVLMGMFDIGQAIIINQKITAAAHMASDLVTRKTSVDIVDLNDAYGLTQLVIDPYNRDGLGVDIAGIKFNEDDNPEVKWRYTRNMSADSNIPGDADGLGINGEGLVAVTATFTYKPFFTKVLVSDITMTERAFLRGRKNSFVRYSGDEDDLGAGT